MNRPVIPSRRGLLAGGAAALLAGEAAVAVAKAAPPPAAASDDTELLRMCAEFDRLTLLERSYYRGGANYIEDDDERDDVIKEFGDEHEALKDRIADTPAKSHAGRVAKVRTVLLWAPDLAEYDPAREYGWDRQLTASVLRDMAGDLA